MCLYRWPVEVMKPFVVQALEPFDWGTYEALELEKQMQYKNTTVLFTIVVCCIWDDWGLW